MQRKSKQFNDISKMLRELFQIIQRHQFLKNANVSIDHFINIITPENGEPINLSTLLNSLIAILSDPKGDNTLNENFVHNQFNIKILQVISLLIGMNVAYDERYNNKLMHYTVDLNAYDLFINILSYHLNIVKKTSTNEPIVNLVYNFSDQTESFLNPEESPICQFMLTIMNTKTENNEDKINIKPIKLVCDTFNNKYGINYILMDKKQQQGVLTFLLVLHRKKNECLAFKVPKPVTGIILNLDKNMTLSRLDIAKKIIIYHASTLESNRIKKEPNRTKKKPERIKKKCNMF